MGSRQKAGTKGRQESGSTPERTTTRADTIRYFGVQGKTVDYWRSVGCPHNPGPPTSFDIAEVEAWRAERGLPAKPRRGRPSAMDAATSKKLPPPARAPTPAAGPSSMSPLPEMPTFDADDRELGAEVRALLERGRLTPEELERIKAAYALARAQKEREVAEARRLDNEKARGELVARVDVEAANAQKFHAVRAALERLPARAAQKAAALEDPRDVEALLVEEVDRVLRDLHGS